MRRNIRKLTVAVTLLLVLSQWLSLAHATGHLLHGDNPECQTCTLQHHFHTTTLDTIPCAIDVTTGDAPYLLEHQPYIFTLSASKSIRAPPSYPHS